MTQSPSDMDPQCVLLCTAINSILGLRTTSSCCGHGKQPFRVYLEAAQVRDLYPLLRSVDYIYGGPSHWSCLAVDTDLPEAPVMFCLNSGSVVGETAYQDADAIAARILDFLKHPEWMQHFQTDKRN